MSIANPMVTAAFVRRLPQPQHRLPDHHRSLYRERKRPAPPFGALIGAGAGAAIGMISGHDAKQRRQRALVGRRCRRARGGAVGNYMDRQESELRALMRDSGVTVTRKGEDISSTCPATSLSAPASADLNAQFFKVLDGSLRWRRNTTRPSSRSRATPTTSAARISNRQLSQRRASAVAQYLQGRGVSRTALITAAGGEDHPIASNSTIRAAPRTGASK